MTTDAQQQWKAWHEERTGNVAAPYGPLSLTGTFWLADLADGRIPAFPGDRGVAVPGRWTEAGGAVLLTAAAGDGLTVDGRPAEGEYRLTADGGPATARVAHGTRRLLVMCREDLWAVRVYDPESAARREFTGIRVFDHDPRWSLPGRYRPYERDRRITVENADGRERGLGLSGELAFDVDGEERTLRVAAEPGGGLWAVFADGTSGGSSYRFRFLHTPPPAPDGRVTVDFNRAVLPPCAFADAFICPFPPPGNTLTAEVAAGERDVL